MNADVHRAWAAWDLNRPAEALRQAERALASDPNDPNAHLIRGRALVDLRRPTDALEALDRASALSPRWAWPHLVRSDVLATLGDYDAALMAAEETARLAPQWASAHVARALRLRAIGRLDEAIAAADEAVQLDPGDAHTLGMRGYVVLTARPAEAEALYRQSLALDPYSAMNLNNLGAALTALGRYAEAGDCYRAALRIDPMLTIARNNLEDAQRHDRWRGFVLGYCVAGAVIMVGITLGDGKVAVPAAAVMVALVLGRAFSACRAFVRAMNALARDRGVERSP